MQKHEYSMSESINNANICRTAGFHKNVQKIIDIKDLAHKTQNNSDALNKTYTARHVTHTIWYQVPVVNSKQMKNYIVQWTG